MATERQIAANRRNASKSTGPRSRAGKKRARQNAYQHGLTTSLHSSAAVAEQVEDSRAKSPARPTTKSSSNTPARPRKPKSIWHG